MQRFMLTFFISLCVLISLCNLFSQEDWVEEQLEKAFLLIDEEKYHEAIDLLERAVESAKQRYGENHKAVGDLSRELASIYLFDDELEKAEDLYKQALRIYEQSSGPNDASVAELHMEFASFYEMQEKMLKAESHMRQAVEIFKTILDPDDPMLLDLQEYLRDLSKSKPLQETELEEIEKKEEKILIEKPVEKEHLPEIEELSEKEKVVDEVKPPEAEQEKPQKKLTIDKDQSEGFEIINVECPKIFTFDKSSKRIKFPSMTVTYRLNSIKNQVEWNEKFEVICPDGKVLDAGGGQQWYNSSHQGNKRTYTVKGYSTTRDPGTYRFRLKLEGENLKTQVVERSFEVK